MAFNEYGPLKRVALRTAGAAFVGRGKAALEWRDLRFLGEPEIDAAKDEYQTFQRILEESGANCTLLPGNDALTLDAIYVRDATILSPRGLILCRMGRTSRGGEPATNAKHLEREGITVLGEIAAPGTLEGGDFIWLDERTAAVGLGPRTNEIGIQQLAKFLGTEVELHVVPLPPPEHPGDVFHLMSMISPLDTNLALIYRPLMPQGFLGWLEAHGIGFAEVPDEEYLRMGCNVLALGPRHCLMLDTLPVTRSRLEAAGCKIETYKGDEISRKGEGGPTCLTLPLERGPAAANY